jgi:hypothetical protein
MEECADLEAETFGVYEADDGDLHWWVSDHTTRAAAEHAATTGSTPPRARRALILTAALVANPDPIPANRAREVLTWLADCWEAAYEVAAC